MSSLTVTGDLKYLLFIFLGIMVAILVLGYHHSPTASPSLGATQMRGTVANTPMSISRNSSPMIPVSTESYGEIKY